MCEHFKELSVEQRREKVPKLNICFNCLGGGHRARYYRRSTCRTCNKRHHTLLHKTAVSSETIKKAQESETPVVAKHAAHLGNNLILLSTAKVYVKSAIGKYLECTALLDLGS